MLEFQSVKFSLKYPHADITYAAVVDIYCILLFLNQNLAKVGNIIVCPVAFSKVTRASRFHIYIYAYYS